MNGLHIASNQIIQVLFYRSITRLPVQCGRSLMAVWAVRSAEIWDIFQAAIPITIITQVFSGCAVSANRNLPECVMQQFTFLTCKLIFEPSSAQEPPFLFLPAQGLINKNSLP